MNKQSLDSQSPGKGVFCISIDHELLWGRKDLDYKPFIPRVKKERKIITRLLALFKKYDIPATWATVGKLFENGDPLWHTPDSIKEIGNLKNQEIGSHSYSHPTFTEISRKYAEEEIKKCAGLHSFVFPRNKIKYLYLLKKYGFAAYRGKDLRNWELLYPRIPPVYEPKVQNGIVNIRGSMYFVSGRGVRKYIPRYFRYYKVKMGIEKAINEKKIFHLWFHPVDFADDTEKLFSDLENILVYIAQKRKEGKLETKTMKQIADEIL